MIESYKPNKILIQRKQEESDQTDEIINMIYKTMNTIYEQRMLRESKGDYSQKSYAFLFNEEILKGLQTSCDSIDMDNMEWEETVDPKNRRNNKTKT